MAFTIAIDGPAAAGKGTIGRALAAHFGFAHLDTGLLYRAVGTRVLTGEAPMDAARALRASPNDRRSDLIYTLEQCSHQVGTHWKPTTTICQCLAKMLFR